MNKAAFTPEDIRYLLSPQAVRERAQAIYERALEGETHFRIHENRIPEVAKFVTEVTLANYPDLKIPFHSRWGHFQVGGVDRLRDLESKLAGLSREERARAKLDLVIVSVLLDAGSGPQWKYREASTGKTLDRSEGLAVASLHMFLNGDFSSDCETPLRVDSKKLMGLKIEDLARGFQVSQDNPLVGLEGRLELLHALGRAVRENSKYFPTHSREFSRPGHIYDFCQSQAKTGALPAPELLLAVLHGLGSIWPGRIRLGDTNLGDVWTHRLLGPENSVKSFVPFHKLSQWLTYSLIEPLEEAGVKIENVQGLTGLAEYRNGGLLLDRGLIELRDASLLRQGHRPDSELIIEWRALTVVLLGKIAHEVRTLLKKTEEEMPLAKVLEGGTWWAGRRAAQEARPGGGPPIQVLSDGTVF